ncbi:MAG: preprotein translocase subunit SecG [Bacteroidaceae bacterium]|nr:preprotein translocase subunit SecG [Bacteroidaceae bacterium]
MYTVLVILIVIAALLMIGIVLIQESKGGGLASGFSSGNQIMGVRKTTDFIEKATWVLAAAMVVISIGCAYVVPKATAESSVIENVATPKQQQTAPTNLPGFGASEQKAPASEQKTEAPATENAKPADNAAPAAAAETPAEPAAKK